MALLLTSAAVIHCSAARVSSGQNEIKADAPPPPPTLVSPANDAVNQPTILTLIWNHSGLASTYHLQVSTDSLFTTLVHEDTSLTDTSHQVGPLVNLTTHFWRVTATDTTGTSDWSTVWHFTAISANAPIVVTSPATSVDATSATLNGMVNPKGLLTTVKFEYGTTTIYGNEVTAVQSPLTGTTLQPVSALLTGLSPHTTYHFRAVASNSAATIAGSDQQFTTQAQIVSERILVPITIRDNGVGGTVDSFGVHVYATYCTDGDLGAGLVEAQLPPKPPTGVFDARFTDTRTGADACMGTGQNLDLKQWRSAGEKDTFKLEFQPSNAGYPFHFSWPSGLSDFFDTLRIEDLFGLKLLNVNMLNDTSFDLTNTAFDKFYIIAYPVPYTTPPPPNVPTLTSPANGSTVQTLRPTLSWNPALGATTYHLQASGDSLFVTTLFNDTTLIRTSHELVFTENLKTHYWRLRAKNISGFSAWSETWNFTTNVPLPDQVALISPPDSATVNADSVLCVWQRSSPDVNRYWFEFSMDSLVATPTIDSMVADTFTIARQFLSDRTYWWKVRAYNIAGWGTFSETRRFSTRLTRVNDELTIPRTFNLSQNFPNPFNPGTTISYQLPVESFVTLKVYDILGQEVKTLGDEVQRPGGHSIRWNGLSNDGNSLPSGVYLYRLVATSITDPAESFVKMMRMLMVK